MGKLQIALVGTIRDYRYYNKILTDKIDYVFVYHDKCLEGATFDGVVGLSENPYLMGLKERADLLRVKK